MQYERQEPKVTDRQTDAHIKRLPMTADFVAVLNRISADFKLLADLAQKALEGGGNATPSSAADPTSTAIEVPLLKDRYTKEEAETEKARIETAFRSDKISWDKKRGMKMLVTKRTVGWSSVN